MPFCPFCGGGFPTKIDYRKKGTLILTSLLDFEATVETMTFVGIYTGKHHSRVFEVVPDCGHSRWPFHRLVLVRKRWVALV